MISTFSNPTQVAPQNAWILIGDTASFPTSRDIAAMHADARRGVHGNLWTAPMNSARGDLVLFYFTAPLQTVNFVARLASDPFWDDNIDANAENEFEGRHWKAHTTRLIEIAPINFRELSNAHDGSLILDGRLEKFITPEVFTQLTFTATEPTHQAELEQMVTTPTGIAHLPDPTSLTFDSWTQLASGALPLEASVSRYVVEPLFEFMNGVCNWDVFRPTLEPQYRVATGYVDYVAIGAEPLLAVEVKLATRRPSSANWLDSPDFRQLRRHMDELDVPGILIDANSVLLIGPGETGPTAEFSRARATADDLERISTLVYLAMNRKYGGTEAAIANAADQSKLFWAFLPGCTFPVLVLRAVSWDSPAIQAMAVFNAPVFHDLALRFLGNESCGNVARDYLGSHLLDDHAFMTVMGGAAREDFPEATVELMQFVGTDWAARFRQIKVRSTRRVVRRG